MTISSLMETGLFLLVIVLAFSGTGLVAIGAGQSKRHWFLSTAVAVGVCALFLLIPAYDLFLWALVQSIITIFCLRTYRRRQHQALSQSKSELGEPRLGGHQIGLRDLFLLMGIVALISAMIAPIPRRFLGDAPLPGTFLALGTLAAAWIGLGRARRGWRLLTACLLFPALFMALFLSLLRPSSAPLPRWRKAAAALLALLILAPPALAFYRIRALRLLPEPTPSAPNAYSDWVQAAQPLANVSPPTEEAPEALRSFVAQYRSALDQAHAAIQRPCHISLQYNDNDFNRRLKDMEHARQLARSFDSEAAAAHFEQRNDEVLRICLDQFRLANAISRGGLVTHWLVKVAIEWIGIPRIMAIRHGLSAPQCRKAIAEIQKLDAESEPFDAAATRDQAWDMRCYGWQAGLREQVSSLLGSSPQHSTIAVAKLRQARLHLLLTELALCAYRQEHDGLPESLAELVPDYLPAALEDPFSGEPLIYRQTATGYQLYSVGYDGKDDGGRASSPGLLGPGDLPLEGPWPR